MKSTAFLSRNRRLLVLCAVSVALHGALLELAAQRQPGPLAPPMAPAPLALRLVGLAPHAHGSAAATQRAPEPEPGQQATRPAPAPAAAPVRPAAPPARPRQAAPPAPAMPGSNTASAPATAQPVPGARLLVQMPGRYRVSLPPSARLRYELLLQGRPAPDRPAYLDWRSDGASYTLDIDGLAGRLSSRGMGGDAGIVPLQASETQGDRALRTSFDPETGEVRFAAGGASAQAVIGMQDRASVLVQLAAIGRASTEQMQDVIRIAVADAAAVVISQYQVLGQEDVATGIGTLPAWHLAQAAAPGQARLELWLAPSQDWLPVQLRLTAADGSVSTQVLTRVER
ncbi:DUF3108 domain-containing protein [Massilia aerilata]|uniref:DUF3108 domain-containing protein n=1 Tax=Massilia aerilata TaxID=453817 RepID=A0ABW0RVA9_9BURK